MSESKSKRATKRERTAAKASGNSIPAEPTNITGEQIIAASNVSGAKSGKDAVPAGRDWSQSLMEVAVKEKGAILGQIQLNGTRIECWTAVGEIAQQSGIGDMAKAKAEIFDNYSAMVFGQLVEQAFLDAGCEKQFAALDALGKVQKKRWPQIVQDLYNTQIQPRHVETKRAMNAFVVNFLPTLQLLKGEGTINQKMLEMPKRSNAGKPRGTPNDEKGPPVEPGTTTAPTAVQQASGVGTAEEKQAQLTNSVRSLLNNVSTESIPDLMSQLTHVGKANKRYSEDKHFQILVDSMEVAVNKYFAAINAERAPVARKAEEAEKQAA